MHLKMIKLKAKKPSNIQVFEKLISKLHAVTKIESEYTKSIKFLIFIICKGFHHLLNKFNKKLFIKINILNLIKDINIYTYFLNRNCKIVYFYLFEHLIIFLLNKFNKINQSKPVSYAFVKNGRYRRAVVKPQKFTINLRIPSIYNSPSAQCSSPPCI